MVHGRWRACSLAVSTKQWHQRHSVKGQTLLQLSKEQPRTQAIVAMVPFEAMANLRICDNNGSTEKNRAKVWRKITLSYLQSQYKSMLRRRRAFGKIKEGKTMYQDCYGHVNCIILSVKRPLVKNAINFFPR